MKLKEPLAPAPSMPRNGSTDRRSGATSPKRTEYIFRMIFQPRALVEGEAA